MICGGTPRGECLGGPPDRAYGHVRGVQSVMARCLIGKSTAVLEHWNVRLASRIETSYQSSPEAP